jgi:preprotein translocase subunit SecA
MLQIFKKVFGDKHSKNIKELDPVVIEINEFYEQVKDLSDDELRGKTQEFKQRIQDHTAEIRQKVDDLETKTPGG